MLVRRLHDTNRSGWWILIGFIPFIGFLVLLIFVLLDSTEESNQYGPNPKLAADNQLTGSGFTANQAELLDQLFELKEKGAITEAEYEQKKADILASNPSSKTF